VSHFPNMFMDHLYAYRILLCLCTPMSTCLLTHVVSSPTLEINYYRFGYYLPDSYHMPLTDYYFTEAKITDTRSSGIPELRHTFEYSRLPKKTDLPFSASTPCPDSVLITGVHQSYHYLDMVILVQKSKYILISNVL
jgi:hypothetical protein